MNSEEDTKKPSVMLGFSIYTFYTPLSLLCTLVFTCGPPWLRCTLWREVHASVVPSG